MRCPNPRTLPRHNRQLTLEQTRRHRAARAEEVAVTRPAAVLAAVVRREVQDRPAAQVDQATRRAQRSLTCIKKKAGKVTASFRQTIRSATPALPADRTSTGRWIRE